MDRVNILFLGAGRRLTLLEHFKKSGEYLGLDLTIYSAELSKQLPIALVATILEAPKFFSTTFNDWLVSVVEDYSIDLIIPCMDAATVALSSCVDLGLVNDKTALVSSNQLCRSMYDKSLADTWFRDQGLLVPDSKCYPKIVKPRAGFGAKGIFTVNSPEDMQELMDTIDISDYHVQDFIEGTEYSVDVYVDESTLALRARQRLYVVSGEAWDTRITSSEMFISPIKQCLLAPGWKGPLTFQFIVDRFGTPFFEVNPVRWQCYAHVCSVVCTVNYQPIDWF